MKSKIDAEIDYHLARIFLEKVGGDINYAMNLLKILSIDDVVELICDHIEKDEHLYAALLKDYQERQYRELKMETIYEPFPFV